MASKIENVPPVSPRLVRQIILLMFIYIPIVYFLSLNFQGYVQKFLVDNGVAFHLAIVGISATLAGFIAAGIAIISTILSKPELVKSRLAKYYNQIYNSLKSAVLSLILVMVLSLISSVYPKNQIISLAAFYTVIYLFLLSLISMWYSVIIISGVLDLNDKTQLLEPVSDEINFTENEAKADGSLRSND